MKKIVFKLSAMLMCVLFIFSLAPAMPIYAKDDIDVNKKTDIAGIEYHNQKFFYWQKLEGDVVTTLGKTKYTGSADEKQTPIFIVAKNNGKERRYLSSNQYYKLYDDNLAITDENYGLVSLYASTSFKENRYFSETAPFLTKDARGAFFVKYQGQTNSWSDVPQYSFHYPDSTNQKASTLVLAPERNGWDYFWRKETKHDISGWLNLIPKWAITNLYGTPFGCVKIFCDRPGSEDQWINFKHKTNGEMPMFGVNYFNCGGKWSNFDNLEIWVGTEVEYNIIDWAYTVQTGQVFNIEGNVLITEKGSLTIEKGAAVSVKDQMFNNGKIYNNGTLVIQANSGISPYDTNGLSEIICDGGDIVMLKDSRMYFDENARFTMKNGATLVNSGAFVSEKGMDISDSTWDIRENGSMFLNLGLNDNLSQVCNIGMTSGKIYRTNSNDYTTQIYKRLNGMVDKSWAFGPSNLTALKDYANTFAVMLGKNVTIINNGYMLVNGCFASLYNDLQYVQRGNGMVERTDRAKSNNAALTYFSDSHPKYRYTGNYGHPGFSWTDYNSVITENNKATKFWVEYKPN